MPTCMVMFTVCLKNFPSSTDTIKTTIRDPTPLGSPSSPGEQESLVPHPCLAALPTPHCQPLPEKTPGHTHTHTAGLLMERSSSKWTTRHDRTETDQTDALQSHVRPFLPGSTLHRKSKPASLFQGSLKSTPFEDRKNRQETNNKKTGFFTQI